MIAQIRNVCDHGEADEEGRKDGKKLVESHPPALAEDVVPPGFQEGTAQ